MLSEEEEEEEKGCGLYELEDGNGCWWEEGGVM